MEITAETAETWDKASDLTDNIFRTPCMFCEEIELFRNVSVHEFYRLKALITKEQVNA